MPFSQMEKIKSMVKIWCILLAIVIAAGCVAQKTENIQTTEQVPKQQEPLDKSAVASGARQISAVSVELQDQTIAVIIQGNQKLVYTCLLYTSPSPRDRTRSRMPSSA